MSNVNSTINRLVLVGLGVAAFYIFSRPKDYGPPPDNRWFRSAVLNQSGPVLVKFGATWCGPCRATDAELTQLSQSGPWPVVKIDVDEQPSLAQHYGVRAHSADAVVQRRAGRRRPHRLRLGRRTALRDCRAPVGGGQTLTPGETVPGTFSAAVSR